MVDASRAALPNEAVGFLFGERSSPDRFIALEPSSEPGRFSVTGEQIEELIRREGRPAVAFFHSHPQDIAHPSTWDIDGARSHPDLVHLILALTPSPDLRAWLIFDGQVIPESVTVVEEHY